MSRSKTNFRMLLLILPVGLVCTILNAEARPLIQDVLSKGGLWVLTVDGERDKLVILGGNGGQKRWINLIKIEFSYKDQ